VNNNTDMHDWQLTFNRFTSLHSALEHTHKTKNKQNTTG